jgi:hypothetical protein
MKNVISLFAILIAVLLSSTLAFCKALPSGNYLMVKLPKNYGMYDCQNVEMYQGDQDKPEAARKIGEYCMVE